MGFVQVLSGGNPSLLDQRAFGLVGKSKVRELDAQVIDEDRAPFVTRVCLQQNILDVQKRVDDAAGKAPQTIDGRRGLAWIDEMESERLPIRRSIEHLLAGVGINRGVLFIKRVDWIIVQHAAITIGTLLPFCS